MIFSEYRFIFVHKKKTHIIICLFLKRHSFCCWIDIKFGSILGIIFYSKSVWKKLSRLTNQSNFDAILHKYSRINRWVLTINILFHLDDFDFPPTNSYCVSLTYETLFFTPFFCTHDLEMNFWTFYISKWRVINGTSTIKSATSPHASLRDLFVIRTIKKVNQNVRLN